MSDRLFPIQDAEAIPWAVIAPCDRQCQRNHGRQTLERIAERGGLCASEACDVLLGQPWDITPEADAAGRLRQIVKERWYLPELERLRGEFVMSYCKKHKTYPKDDEPCWQCIKPFETTIATLREVDEKLRVEIGGLICSIVALREALEAAITFIELRFKFPEKHDLVKKLRKALAPKGEE